MGYWDTSLDRPLRCFEKSARRAHCMHVLDEKDVAESLVAKIYSKLIQMVTYPIYQLHMTIMHQKSKTFDFHHIEGYQDPSTWAREKGVSKYTPTFGHPVLLLLLKIL